MNFSYSSVLACTTKYYLIQQRGGRGLFVLWTILCRVVLCLTERQRERDHAGADATRILAVADGFRARLQTLRSAGLSTESAHILLHNYMQGCVTHHLRANHELSWLDQFDAC